VKIEKKGSDEEGEEEEKDRGRMKDSRLIK
jgi:hypothetical protein